MSRNRYAQKRDTTEPAIVEALEKAGWQVWRELPVDLLCFRAGVFKTLECKTPRNKKLDPRKDKRRVKQDAFIAATGTARVTTPEAALAAVGAINQTRVRT